MINVQDNSSPSEGSFSPIGTKHCLLGKLEQTSLLRGTIKGAKILWDFLVHHGENYSEPRVHAERRWMKLISPWFIKYPIFEFSWKMNYFMKLQIFFIPDSDGNRSTSIRPSFYIQYLIYGVNISSLTVGYGQFNSYDSLLLSLVPLSFVEDSSRG